MRDEINITHDPHRGWVWWADTDDGFFWGTRFRSRRAAKRAAKRYMRQLRNRINIRKETER